MKPARAANSGKRKIRQIVQDGDGTHAGKLRDPGDKDEFQAFVRRFDLVVKVGHDGLRVLKQTFN
jgi:hypothetical protein